MIYFLSELLWAIYSEKDWVFWYFLFSRLSFLSIMAPASFNAVFFPWYFSPRPGLAQLGRILRAPSGGSLFFVTSEIGN
jgi:hypothetical protein